MKNLKNFFCQFYLFFRGQFGCRSMILKAQQDCKVKANKLSFKDMRINVQINGEK